MSSDPEQRTRLDPERLNPAPGPPKIERRSVLRVAGDKLKAYADKLNGNARRMKEFLRRPK